MKFRCGVCGWEGNRPGYAQIGLALEYRCPKCNGKVDALPERKTNHPWNTTDCTRRPVWRKASKRYRYDRKSGQNNYND